MKKYLDNVPDDEESMIDKMQFKKPESVEFISGYSVPFIKCRGIKLVG